MGFATTSRAFLAVALFLPLLALAAGCYTVLKHPDTPQVVDDYGQRDCYDCHQNAAAHHFDPFYYESFQYYSDRWYPYYGRPWWWRDYWYYDPVPGSGSGIPLETGRRHLWNRGGTSLEPLPNPPMMPGMPTVPQPGQAPAATETEVRTETKKTGDDKGKTTKKEKKREEEKKRHLWDR